ncbi:MAG TPA: hotdog fold domain-containing protein [Kofleriaceae bacterium]|nr:hotdog fold domain-containing protein [Kofleriaceae bacterium]
MNVSAAVQRLVPSLEANGNLIRSVWDRLHGLPGGKRVFSTMVGRAAPYTATIGARVVELGHGRARVELADRKAVRNHLRSVHAVALVNLAELTGNVAVAYSLPDDARFIVAGLEIDYLKKARGTITGVCEVDVPQSSERAEIPVQVEMLDESGAVVARATLRTLIGPKKNQ